MARPRKYGKKPTMHLDLYTDTMPYIDRVKYPNQNIADTVHRMATGYEQLYRENARLREENRELREQVREGVRSHCIALDRGLEMTGYVKVPQLVRVLQGKSGMYEPARGFSDVYREAMAE